MRINSCLWCGKARKTTNPATGYPKGVDVLMDSERFPTVFMHSTCNDGMRRKFKDMFGEDLIENPLMDELKTPHGVLNTCR